MGRHRAIVSRTSRIAFLFLSAFFIIFRSVHAVDIHYNGDQSLLNIAPDASGTTQSFFAYENNDPTAPVASGNAVTINFDTTGSLPNRVFGGVSKTESVNDNTVYMENGAVSNRIYGGYATTAGYTATNNRVLMSGGTVDGDIYGAYTNDGQSSGNQVEMSNGIVGGSITGGVANGTGSLARNNHVILSGTAVAGQDPNDSAVIGGQGTDGSAIDNSVSVSEFARAVNVYGGVVSAGTGVAENNMVEISGGTVTRSVVGGMNFSGDRSGNAVNNRVVISGGDFTGDVIANAEVFGGYTQAGDATGNTVAISGGTNIGNVYGGISFDGGAASNNEVIISGGHFTHFIVGGQAQINGPGASGDATNNTITLTGNPILDDARIYGGGGLGNDRFTGNTLNINGYSGNVGNVRDFENYNFLLSSSLWNGGTVLTTTNLIDGATDLNNTIVAITGVESGATFTPGQAITLISNSQNAPASFSGDNARQGVSLLHTFAMDTTVSDALVVRIVSTRAQTEAKSLPEGRAAALSFLRQGHDFVVDTGIAAADAFLGQTGAGWSTPAFFGAVGGGHSRHKTGSHVDVDGISMLAGLAWRNNGPGGSLLLGAFFEAGYADYDTHNAFASGPVRGDGDSRYAGGGFMGRYVLHNGIYFEASGRVGGVKNKLESDLRDISGNRARYDTTSPYFSAHAGVGYKWHFAEKALLDLTTKYLWSRQNGDTATVTGDPVRFEANTSHRLRTGARIVSTANDCFIPYVGAAFEYEFDGKARAGAYGHNFGVPTLKGGTGIGEIGLTLRRSRFSADLGIQGYVGRREGISGSVRMGWSF